MRRLSKAVMRAQDALRELVSQKAWMAYLHVEEAVNARDHTVIDAAIRIALRRGRRVRAGVSRKMNTPCGNCYDTYLRETARMYVCERCGSAARECLQCVEIRQKCGLTPIETCARCSLDCEALTAWAAL